MDAADIRSATGLELSRADASGRGLFATQSYGPGEIVCSLAPYAAAVLDSKLGSHCTYCMVAPSEENAVTTLRSCSQCKFVKYCSRDHQRLDWVDHKEECQSFTAMGRKAVPTNVRLLARVLRKMIRQPKKASECLGQRAAEVWDLASNWSSQSDGDKEGFAQVALATRAFIMGEGARAVVDDDGQARTESGQPGDDGVCGFSMKQVIGLMAAFKVNNHTLCDSELRPVGVGLCPVGALVNHSCRPNCTQMFDGSKLTFRACAPISPGEEISIAYIDLAYSLHERRAALVESYHFQCHCVRCKDEQAAKVSLPVHCPSSSCKAVVDVPWNFAVGLPLSDHDIKVVSCPECQTLLPTEDLVFGLKDTAQLLQSGTEMRKKGESARAEGILEQCLKKRRKMLPPTFKDHCDDVTLRCKCELVHARVDLGKWQDALDSALSTLGSMEKFYPKCAPLVGLQWYTVGRLAWALERTDMAVEHFQGALKRLAVSHGSSHTMVNAAAQRLSEALAEQQHKQFSQG